MRTMIRCALATTIFLVGLQFRANAQEETSDNPHYKGWAEFKIGSKVVQKETTVFGDGATDEKVVAYELLTVTPNRVTVQTVVIEKDLLRQIETAPTRIIYPAKVSAAALAASLQDVDAKRGKETIKVIDQDTECTTFEMTKKINNEEIKSKSWRSTAIPGGIVKRVRSTHQDGKLVATTTTVLQSFRIGEYKKKEAEKK